MTGKEYAMESAVLRAWFAQSSTGLLLLDPDTRVVAVNTTASRYPGFPPGPWAGRLASDVTVGLAAEEVEPLLRGVLDSGDPAIRVPLRWHPPVTPCPEKRVELSAYRLTAENGRVLGLAVSMIDVTDQYRARRHLEMMRRANALLGTTLDIEHTATELAELAVPDFADLAMVDVLDAVLRGQTPAPGPVDADLPMRRVAYRGKPSAREGGWSGVGRFSVFPAGSPYIRCLTDLRPRLVPELRQDPGWPLLPMARQEGLTGTGVHSAIVVPLVARGTVLGVVSFWRAADPRPFDAHDLALATELGARGAVHLDNARLYTRELSAARLLQLTVRPLHLGAHLAAETARSHPNTDRGDDWFDLIPLSGGRIALTAGDTAGQGLHAAAAMSELRAALSALAALDLPPDEVLERLHALVTRLQDDRLAAPAGTDADIPRPGPTACLYAVYDPASGHCALSSAGHPPPVLAFPDGTTTVAPLPVGPALGHGIPRFRTLDLDLPEGTVLALYNTARPPTGEPRRPEPDPRRLCAALSTAADRPLQELCDTVFAALAPQAPDSDAALVLVRTLVLGPERAATWTWPHDAAAIGDVRTAVARQLAAWNLPDLQDTTTLIASELATNAVRHAEGPFQVRLVRTDDALTCEITDDSSTSPQLRHAEDDDEGGRGLFLTAQLTTRWGVRPTARGKTIWAEQALSGPDPATDR
ncbi:SpoIIE family protein phosphatase [Streptomyces sp. NPDC001443]